MRVTSMKGRSRTAAARRLSQLLLLLFLWNLTAVCAAVSPGAHPIQFLAGSGVAKPLFHSHGDGVSRRARGQQCHEERASDEVPAGRARHGGPEICCDVSHTRAISGPFAPRVEEPGALGVARVFDARISESVTRPSRFEALPTPIPKLPVYLLNSTLLN